MAFISHFLGFEAQQPRQVQFQYPPIFQQPMIPMSPSPHFILMPQIQVPQPVGMMMATMAHPPPLFMITPAPLLPSILPPGATSFPINPPGGIITLRIVFHGHTSDDYTPPFCVSNATYRDPLPSRDALLAGIAIWARHHGLSIQHPGGRIDPLKAKLYVLPKSSTGGGGGILSGIDVVPGVGLVVPGDAIKVVRLGVVEERDWEEALREIEREGYEAVVAVDMSVSAGGEDGGLDTASTTDAAPATPTIAADGDQATAAAST